jgi:hypothetical protein
MKFKSKDAEWPGNVRMDGESTVNKLLEGKPGGGTYKRICRLRWMEDLKWTRNMGVKRWRTRA